MAGAGEPLRRVLGEAADDALEAGLLEEMVKDKYL